MTRNGIEYDLEKSPYKATVENNEEALTMYFSSELNMSKFNIRYHTFTKEIDESLSKRFGLNLHLPLVSALALYHRIEKRGFAVYSSGNQKMMSEDDRFCL